MDNVTGTATGSQIAGIEGYNRIVINNSNLESTNDATSGSDPIKNGVILYQSMSGDADTASTDSCEFEAVDSTLKTSISDGAMFYVTNTKADIHEQDSDYLAQCRRCAQEAAEVLGWQKIPCTRDGALRTIEEIHEDIWTAVQTVLND